VDQLLLWTHDQTHFAPTFPTPALRKNAKERGTHCFGNARKIRSLGHPPISSVPHSPAACWIYNRALDSSAMSDPLFSQSELLSSFIGREKELAWLERETEISRSPANPIVITGIGGIGKTALVRNFVEIHSHHQNYRRISTAALWLKTSELEGEDYASRLGEVVESLYTDYRSSELSVIIDGADSLSGERLLEVLGRVQNFKAVRSIIVTTRRDPGLRGARVLNLDPLPEDLTQLLVQTLLSHSAVLTTDSLLKVVHAVKGHPLAVSLLAGLARTLGDEQLLRIVDGHLYDIEDSATVSKAEMVSVVQPTIISANEAMVKALKKQPEDIFKLSSRKYEELVTELLHDMGYEVELTPATRDGGKDILAYFKTECGTFLCLVEAKRYRADRKIGVELVRTLYGTLCDYQANSAMMVTTSSFSRDAHIFGNKHKYQLALRDYTDLTSWIRNYGKSRFPS
jgi:restriction system protein